MIFQKLNLASKAARRNPEEILEEKKKLLILFHSFQQKNLLKEIGCSLFQNFNMRCEIF